MIFASSLPKSPGDSREARRCERIVVKVTKPLEEATWCSDGFDARSHITNWKITVFFNGKINYFYGIYGYMEYGFYGIYGYDDDNINNTDILYIYIYV